MVDLRNVTIIDLNSSLCCLNTVYLKENLLAHYSQVFNGHQHLNLFLADRVIAQLLSLKSYSFMAPLIFLKPLTPISKNEFSYLVPILLFSKYWVEVIKISRKLNKH